MFLLSPREFWRPFFEKGRDALPGVIVEATAKSFMARMSRASSRDIRWNGWKASSPIPISRWNSGGKASQDRLHRFRRVAAGTTRVISPMAGASGVSRSPRRIIAMAFF